MFFSQRASQSLRRSRPAPWAERWPKAPKTPMPKEHAAGGRMLAAATCLKNDRRLACSDIFPIASILVGSTAPTRTHRKRAVAMLLIT